MSELLVDTIKTSDGSGGLTVPSTAGTLVTSSNISSYSGNLLEVLSFVPQGQTISSKQGNITAENVTAAQVLTDTRTDITGSSIAYTPPSGAVRVEYNFNFHMARDADTAALGEYTFLIDGTEVTKKKTSVGSNPGYGCEVEVKWVIECAHSSNDTDLGWFTSWTSAKTLKCQGRRLSAAQEVQLHETFYWDGATGQHLTLPVLTIKAYS